jgi:hypothetical protein
VHRWQFVVAQIHGVCPEKCARMSPGAKVRMLPRTKLPDLYKSLHAASDNDEVWIVLCYVT